MTNKKFLAGIPGILLVFSFVLIGCPADSSDDDDGITKISTAEEFNAIRNQLDGHYVLEADIDLASSGNFVPIGAFEPLSEAEEDAETPKLELAFTGVLDGNGHKISNVTISAPTQAGVGLFGCVAGEGGVVKNLVVENVTATGYMLVSGVVGYKSSVNTFENITLRGTNSITGTQMVGGIVGGGFGDIKNCNAAADIILTGDGAGAAGILAGGMEDSSLSSCAVTGGSITTVAGSFAIGGLASCAHNAAKVENCTVSNVTITVEENCFMIGGILGYAGRYAPDTPTAISNCTVTNVTISAPASAERIGGIIGSGFYYSVYADMYGQYMPELAAPNAFTVTNSSTSGSFTGACADLVGKIAGYIYDNSTVDDTCTSTMTGATNNVGGDKNSAALDTLK